MLAVANIYRKKTPEEKTGRKVLRKSQTENQKRKSERKVRLCFDTLADPVKNYE